MSTGMESRGDGGPTLRFLPWLVGAGALVVYLLTVNHWVSLFNLGQVGRVAGWSWQPELYSPANFVLTYPLRFLPASVVPLAMNLLAVVLAGLTLMQLARSVILLPHDRTHEQRDREYSESAILTIPLAWLPPVLAVIACGLQLSFWENATNYTGEMLDLLVFALVIRCLLEFRVDGRETWLTSASFIYGIGITNNFAMTGYFPLFLTSLIWLQGLGFFNLRFLGRMFVLGLGGLSLYLLLPLLASLNKIEPVGFWTALKHYLTVQKSCLTYFPAKPFILISLTNLVPVFVMSIRWASQFGDSSRVGQIITTAIFHVSHAVFLFAALWVTLDPPFSPRNAAVGIPFLNFLTLYYLGALAIGYFAGYLLLVFRPKRDRFSSRMRTPFLDFMNRVSQTTLLLLFVLVPAALLARNLSEIRRSNGPVVQQFAEASAHGLPKHGLLLSDDPRRSLVMQAWLAKSGRTKDFIVVDTASLRWPGYHRFLHGLYPDRWPAPGVEHKIKGFDDMELVALMQKQANASEVFYLHPSFGYYFEFFYAEPHGLLYQIKEYPTDTLLPPPLSTQLVQENETFWSELIKNTLPSILAITTSREPGHEMNLLELIFKKLHLKTYQNAHTQVIASLYSRSLNYWGVEMQKQEQVARASEHFKTALELNSLNVVADTNLRYNKKLQAGERGPVELPKSIEDLFGEYYRSWEQVIGANGPFDEPNFCYAQGYTYLRGNLFRQAAQPFDRVRKYSDTDLPSRFWLAQLNLMAKLPDTALSIIKEVRDHPEQFPLDSTNRTDLLTLEAGAWFAKNEPTKVASLVESTLKQFPDDDRLFSAAISIYAQNGMPTNAIALLDRRLAAKPDDMGLLFSKGFVGIQLGRYAESIDALTRLLKIQPDNDTAQLNRAIAYLRNGQFDLAQGDYESLQQKFPTSYQISFGLGDIAFKRNDTNAAIRNYEAYLATAPTNTLEAKLVTERLDQLKGVKKK